MPENEVVSVQDTLDNILKWHGRKVRVQGWLSQCGGFDCHLYSSSEDARRAANDDVEYSPGDKPTKLSIGYNAGFDRKAASLSFSQVIVSGKIDAICHHPDILCMDRAPDIEPTAIKKLEHGK